MDEAQAAGGFGIFLKSRRARIQPSDVGLSSYGARRVPGLRREELAMAAGISPTYYTRLEQGHPAQVSVEVLERLACALHLGEDERQHLFDLSRTHHPAPSPPPTRAIRPGLRQLLDALQNVPAVILDRSTDVLAWNVGGHTLLAPDLPYEAPSQPTTRPNMLRLIFLDGASRSLYPAWGEEASRAVAALRLTFGRFPEDATLISLIGSLEAQSPDFKVLWAGQGIAACQTGTKAFDHPTAGSFELDFEVLHLPDLKGERLITYTAPAGSRGAAALKILTAHNG